MRRAAILGRFGGLELPLINPRRSSYLEEIGNWP